MAHLNSKQIDNFLAFEMLIAGEVETLVLFSVGSFHDWEFMQLNVSQNVEFDHDFQFHRVKINSGKFYNTLKGFSKERLLVK